MSEITLETEKLLKNAVLSEQGQPNRIPENWIWIKSDFAAKWGSGGTPSRKSSEFYNGYIPWIKTGELRDKTIFDTKEKITDLGLKNSSAKLFPAGSVAIAMYGATIGRLGILGVEASTNQACAVGVPYKNTTKDFLFYYFLSQKNKLIEMGKGGAQPNISQTLIKEYPYPLPPLNEQKRLIEKIENLLGKVDEAKQLIEEAKDSFELRRAAILDKAFRGELTRKNQKSIENSSLIFNEDTNEKLYEIPEKWKWVTLESVCETITDGDHQAPPKSEDGIPFLVISNINKGILDFEKTRFVPVEYYNKLQPKRKPQIGDILYSTVGSIGIPVLVDTEKKFCFQRHIAILKPSEKINSKFLYYLMKSNLVYNQALNFATGTAQLTVPLTGLRKIFIPLPEAIEQEFIAQCLENLFEKENEYEKISTLAVKELEKLSQSVLSNAFRGKLGTNNPTEENAIELLKEVLQENVK